MEDGDFYVTKHSNLSEVHIVFHLVANESQLRSKDSSSINSRHPALLGLRNILKVINNLRKLHHIYIFYVPLHVLAIHQFRIWWLYLTFRRGW